MFLGRGRILQFLDAPLAGVDRNQNNTPIRNRNPHPLVPVFILSKHDVCLAFEQILRQHINPGGIIGSYEVIPWDTGYAMIGEKRRKLGQGRGGAGFR